MNVLHTVTILYYMVSCSVQSVHLSFSNSIASILLKICFRPKKVHDHITNLLDLSVKKKSADLSRTWSQTRSSTR